MNAASDDTALFLKHASRDTAKDFRRRTGRVRDFARSPARGRSAADVDGD